MKKYALSQSETPYVVLSAYSSAAIADVVIVCNRNFSDVSLCSNVMIIMFSPIEVIAHKITYYVTPIYLGFCSRGTHGGRGFH